MKKLIFLLLMAFVIVGFVSAFDNIANPPGGITLDVEKIACFGVACGCPVHQVTVLAEYFEAVQLQPAGECALLSAAIETPYNLWEQAAGITRSNNKESISRNVDYRLRL